MALCDACLAALQMSRCSTNNGRYQRALQWAWQRILCIPTRMFSQNLSSSSRNGGWESMTRRWTGTGCLSPKDQETVWASSKSKLALTSTNASGDTRVDELHSLANAELNWALAVLFRPSGLKLTIFETTESDIAQSVDFLMPLPKLDSKGMRVIL